MSSLLSPPPWVKIPLLEQLFAELELRFELKLIPISEVDLKAGLHNQARIKPILEHLKERYRVDLRDDRNPFPAVVYASIGDKLIPSDGNNRLAAAVEEGITEWWAYVYYPQEEIEFRVVTDKCNSILNGETFTTQERTYKAMDYVRRGTSRKDAAQMFGIPESVLSVAIRKAKELERCRKLKVDAKSYADLSDWGFVEICGIACDGALPMAFAVANKEGIKATLGALREGNARGTTQAEREENQKALLAELLKVKTAKVLTRPSRLKGEEPFTASLRKAEETIKKALSRQLDEYQEATLKRIRDLLG